MDTDKLQKAVGKTIEKIISSYDKDGTPKIQINFTDTSKLILTVYVWGYEVEEEDITVEFYE